MKQIKTLIFLLIATLFANNVALAIVSSPKDANWKQNAINKLNLTQKAAIKAFEGKIDVLQNSMKPDAKIDFNDPVKKWLWFCLIALVGAIVTAFFLPIVSYLLGTASSIFFIVWLVKYFNLM